MTFFSMCKSMQIIFLNLTLRMTPSKLDHSSVITVSGKAHPVFSALHSIFIWTVNTNEPRPATTCGMPAPSPVHNINTEHQCKGQLVSPSQNPNFRRYYIIFKPLLSLAELMTKIIFQIGLSFCADA